LGNTDARAKLDGDIHALLVQKFGREFVFATTIHRSVKHREATVYGRTIFEHAGGQQPAEQYRTLAREIRSRLIRIEAAPGQDHELLEANRG
jgi:cellulose biosynthesis protein BcsQ